MFLKVAYKTLFLIYFYVCPALGQSSLLGWFPVAPPNKRPRVTTDYSIANPIGVAFSEMEGKRRDDRFYARAMDSSVNDLSRYVKKWWPLYRYFWVVGLARKACVGAANIRKALTMRPGVPFQGVVQA